MRPPVLSVLALLAAMPAGTDDVLATVTAADSEACAVATVEAPTEAAMQPPEPSPPLPTYRPPCTVATCACAWVPTHVGDTWYIARTCGSTRIVVTPARFAIRDDPLRADEFMAGKALDKAVILNRLYGIGRTGWSV